jgi:hypothetical protein
MVFAPIVCLVAPSYAAMVVTGCVVARVALGFFYAFTLDPHGELPADRQPSQTVGTELGTDLSGANRV